MSIAVTAPQRILMAEAQLLSPEQSSSKRISSRGTSIVGRERNQRDRSLRRRS